MAPNHRPQIYSLTVAKGHLVIMLLILASLALLTVTPIALAQGGDYASISRGANNTVCNRASSVSGGLPMWPKEFLTIVHDAG